MAPPPKPYQPSSEEGPARRGGPLVFSPREGVGAELEFQDLARRPLAAFHVKGSTGAHRGPQSPALPAGIRIVDSSIHPFGVKTQWIGDAEDVPFSVLQGQQSFGGVAGVDGDTPP